MFAVLQFPPSNFLISFLVCIILRVSLLLIRWHVFSAWVAWCRYFKFLLVICCFDICSSNVVSDGLHFSESNYLFIWEYFLKVDALFNMLMIFFLSILERYFSGGAQLATIIVFSFWIFLICGSSSWVFTNMSFASIFSLELS